MNIPVSGINIGPVHKKDVMRASVMLERKRKEFACILAFDVKVTPEARDMAEELGVKVFTADIIYHLFDQVSGRGGSSSDGPIWQCVSFFGECRKSQGAWKWCLTSIEGA